MRTDSGLTPGLSDTLGRDGGEPAVDREGRSGFVEQAPRTTRNATRVRGHTRWRERCLATPRTLSPARVWVPHLVQRLADTVMGGVGAGTSDLEGICPQTALNMTT
jgi:hypothetical protein